MPAAAGPTGRERHEDVLQNTQRTITPVFHAKQRGHRRRGAAEPNARPMRARAVPLPHVERYLVVSEEEPVEEQMRPGRLLYACFLGFS